jgi:hypothetical protein
MTARRSPTCGARSSTRTSPSEPGHGCGELLPRPARERTHLGVGGAPSYFDRVLGGLTEADLRARPAEGVNSIVWLLWHMARTEDASVNLVVAHRPQVLDDDWVHRLGVPWRHIGTGMTDDEVSELTRQVDVAAVRAYRDAVGRRTREVVRALAPAAWNEPVTAADTARAAAAGAFGPRAPHGTRPRRGFMSTTLQESTWRL